MRKIIAGFTILAAILFLCLSLQATPTTYVLYTDTVNLPNGSAASGAQVFVYQAGTTAAAQLYSSPTGGAINNPVTTNSSGAFSFYVAPGVYDLKIVQTGYNIVWSKNLAITSMSVPVTSVAGRTGDIVLTQADISGLTTSDTPTFTGLNVTGTSTFAGITTTGTSTLGSTSMQNLGTAFFASRYASLNAVHAAAAAVSNSVIILDSNSPLASSLTSTVPIVWQGGVITKSTGTLTMSPGELSAPKTAQVFSGFPAGGVVGLREVTPYWWGAKADGSTVDTAAWNAALACFVSPHDSVSPPYNDIAQFGGVFNIPKGTSMLDAQIVFPSSMPLDIRGKGQGISQVMWTAGAATMGWSFAESYDTDFVKIHDLDLITQQTNTGVAISMDRSGEYYASKGMVWTRVRQRLLVDSVSIMGSVNTSYGWNGGILLTNVMNSRINGIIFTGVEDSTWTGTNFAAYGIEYTGNYYGVDNRITNSWIFAAQYGIYGIGNLQGILVDGCSLVEVTNGIYLHVSGNQPGFTITNTHINATTALMDLNSINSVFIQHCLFYTQLGVGGYGLIASNIGSGLNISDNEFHVATTPSTVWNPIHILTTSAYGRISNNYFYLTGNAAGSSTAITLDSGVSNIFIGDNLYSNVTNKVSDSGTSNFFTDAVGSKRTTTADSAPAGVVGELITATNSVGSALTNNTALNVTSISLSPGDWDIWGGCTFLSAGTTVMTGIICGISTTSASFPDYHTNEDALNQWAGSVTGAGMTIPGGRVRLATASTTTVYLVGLSSFTTSTNTAYGKISARRAR